MKLEDAIQQKKGFKSPWHKLVINLFYRGQNFQYTLNESLKNYGITISQFNILRILRGSHPQALCINDIKSRIVDKNADVSRLIDRLILKKLAIKSVSPEDQRKAQIHISEAGLALLEQVDQDPQCDPDNMFKKFPKKLAEDLNQLLDQLD